MLFIRERVLNTYGGSMTLGELLGQDGAFVLLGIGAVLGFLVGRFFRVSTRRKESYVQKTDEAVSIPDMIDLVPASNPANSTAVIAVITAAVHKYRSENS